MTGYNSAMVVVLSVNFPVEEVCHKMWNVAMNGSVLVRNKKRSQTIHQPFRKCIASMYEETLSRRLNMLELFFFYSADKK